MEKGDITPAVVARLVAEQFPQWAGLPVERVAVDGWDNTTFRLGDALSVRLPSTDAYVAQVHKEHRWLPILARHLPLLIPEPVAMGQPGGGFSRPWSIYRWIEGSPASPDRVADLSVFAADLAGFLAALYTVDASGTRHALDGVGAGVVDHGGAGPQGVTATPGYLTVATAPAAPKAAAGPAALLSAYAGDGPVARLDAVLVQPEVEWLVLGGGRGGQALLRSFARSPRTRAVTLEGTGPTMARAYDQRGTLVATVTSASGTVAAPVAPGGFTLVTR